MRAAHVVILIAGICGDLSTCRAVEGPAHLACSAGPESGRFALRGDGRDVQFSVDADNAWIEIREVGQTITVDGAAAEEVIDIPQPLRFGSHWVRFKQASAFSIKRFDPGDAYGALTVALHCGELPELQRWITTWLRRAGALASKIDKPSDPEKVPALLDEARVLLADAHGANDAALAQHLYALALLINGRGAEASEAYATAEKAWAKADNSDGSVAARVGRTYALVQASAFQAVLDLTTPVEQLHGQAKPYLFLRNTNERCLSLQGLDRLDEAEKCYAWTLAGYERLHEQTDYTVTLQNYASIKRDLGDFDAARRLGEHGMRIATGPFAPIVRGRYFVMLADLDIKVGEISRALRDVDSAFNEFSVYKSARWQANAYMLLADLYTELGSYDEAYDALGEATKRLNARDDSSRLAHAMLSFADLEHRNGHAQSALLWTAAAESVYQRLAMQSQADSARAERVAMRLERGDTDIIDGEVLDNDASAPSHAGRWGILRARLALQQGNVSVAHVELERLQRTPLSLRNRIEAGVLGAELLAHSGDSDGAQMRLRGSAREIQALSHRVRGNVLQYVIGRQQADLRRSALRLALSSEGTANGATDVAWAWIALAANDESALHPSGVGDDKFDRAVADELLVNHSVEKARSAGAVTQRELLSRLAQPDRESVQPAKTAQLALHEFQATLEAGSSFIAYLDGGEAGALLWITRETAQVVPAAPPDQVRSGVIALQQAISQPGSSIAQVHSALRELSERLLAGIPAAQPPSRLYVLADEISRAIPWGALVWRGNTQALVESTAVSEVRFSRRVGAEPPPGASTMPNEIRVVVSAQQRSASTSLPVLENATVEATQIRSVTAKHEISVVEDSRATRADAFAAFDSAGAWVHVAAHGFAQPQRIGFAGLWLEPAAPDTAPAFLSWIDVLDKGVKNDLVVLDACQSADNGIVVNGNLSFADAVSRAGARRVVAVMWPVSDAASALWVPAFYDALTADPLHDTAQALRAAQLRLRASRAFTHPFFWASLLSLERIELPEGTEPH